MLLSRKHIRMLASLPAIAGAAEYLKIGQLMTTAKGERHDVVDLHEGMRLMAVRAGVALVQEQGVDFMSRDLASGISLSSSSGLSKDAAKLSYPNGIFGSPCSGDLALNVRAVTSVLALAGRKTVEVLCLILPLASSRTHHALSVAGEALFNMPVSAWFSGPVVLITGLLRGNPLFYGRPHTSLLQRA